VLIACRERGCGIKTLRLSFDTERGDHLFPDPSSRWRPYPSIIDGIERPPWVFVRGHWRGVLHLIVLASQPGHRAYRIDVSCEIFAGFEEMIYSVSGHGNSKGVYDGGVYIKEAESSALLTAYATIDPAGRTPRHFLFVGSDYCYEVIGFSEPVITAFRDAAEAYEWRPRQERDVTGGRTDQQ
jgi:hypothetical protein